MKRLLVLVVLAACGTDPAQVAGNYTSAVTNRDNGCNYSGWQVGTMTSGIAVQITQAGTSVSATVNGLAGGAYSLAFGTNVFTGSIDGSALNLQITGSVAQNMGNCAYTRNADLVATYANNSISGQVRYTNADNANSDCIPGCVSVQDFAGSRPPQ